MPSLARRGKAGRHDGEATPPLGGAHAAPAAAPATTPEPSPPAGRGADSAVQRPRGGVLREELPAVILLVVLYALQGVPLGLSMGSMPFLMQAKMSYTKIGVFSLAGYPYSFKLLWSPIVDSLYWPALGRRRSWILPLQTCSALLMLLCGPWLEVQLEAGNAAGVTSLFFLLVLLAATQDIAVDGWALTLLSKRNVGYAATCQTVGMNIGFFTSFTVFLALNDASFCNKWLPEGWSQPGSGMVSLAGYLRFWGWAYLAITVGIAFLTRERPVGKGSSSGASGAITSKSGGKSGSKQQQQQQQKEEGSNGEQNGTRRRSSRLAATPGKQSVASLSAGAGVPPPPPAAPEPLPAKGGRLADSSASLASLGDSRSSSWLQLCQEGEEAEEQEEVLPLKEAYLQLWRVVRLPTVQLLALVLVTSRLGMLTAEAAAPLKLLEKGVSKEALAGLVLAEFPMEVLSALVAGRWAASSHPFAPWMTGYRARLFLAALSTFAVYRFPVGAAALSDAPAAFAVIALLGVATSFTSTLMFTSLGSFFNKISDPSMGGAYLTLLNTVANVGVTVPKLLVFAAMDWLTQWDCVGAASGVPATACGASGGRGAAAASRGGSPLNACTAVGGRCEMLRDGFYVMAGVGVCAGLAVMFMLRRVLPKLEAAPLAAWHARIGSKVHLS